MNPLSAVYGRVTRLRRNWYARHPDRRRRLPQPVISVGNLVTGGSGKTPLVASLAELLRRAGERPAILSRGYGRRVDGEDLVIVSDGVRVLEPVERSGDEPQLLARTLRGVPVIVARRRYQAGEVADRQFGCTVMVLDDGFQHVQLARDVDLLMVSPDDLGESLLPSGVLREPLSTAVTAHALLVTGTDADARLVSGTLGVARAYTVTPRYEAPWLVSSPGVALEQWPGAPVLAVAAIARPHRFFAALRQTGWNVVGELVFRDHHWFSQQDFERIAAAARAARAELVMTTEKDAMRIAIRPAGPPWAALPMRVSIAPEQDFTEWIAGRLADVRGRPLSSAADH